MAYLLDAKVATEGTDTTSNVDVSSNFEDFDLAAVFGAGVSVGSLSLEARYTFGLTNVDATGVASAAETKHRVFALMAGVSF